MDAPIPPETGEMVSESCLCLSLQRAARTVARRFDKALKPVGLSNGQFSLMILLTAETPPTISGLAAALATDRTTLTANLKPLGQRGLVAVTPDARDRRNRRVTLTEAGQALLRQAMPLWHRAQAATLERRNPVSLGDMRRGLRALAT
jgi:DNA-binding MarR family transcriptional regulator